jgi:type II secretory ATPase GspE/PulE/Tfp pilus assembly ATPase PilB-like protein
MQQTKSRAKAKPRPIEGFPLPPLTADPQDNAVVVGDAVTITPASNSGARVAGALLAFNTENLRVAIIPDDGSDRVDLDFTGIKILTLTRVRFWSQEHLPGEAKEHVERKEEAATQPFEIQFRDGDSLSGNTLGFRNDKGGIYVYPTQAKRQYIVHFVPHEAIENFSLGERIGDVLVKEDLVDPKALQSALDMQAQSRERTIGSILKDAAVCTAKELETALDRQRSLPQRRIGDILIEEHIITDEQLGLALERQKGDRGKPLGEILIDLGLVTPERLQYCLARKLGIPFVDLSTYEFPVDIPRELPDAIARQYGVVPLYLNGNRLVVAMVNPLEWQTIDAVRFHCKRYLEAVMATAPDITAALDLLYPRSEIEEASLEEIEASAGEQEGETEEETVAESDNTVVKLANRIIIDAWRRGASDIHIEPQPGKKKALVRLRRDGSLVSYFEVPGSLSTPLVSRLKIMANLDISERRKPQDGKIVFRRPGGSKIELRVATLPTVGGTEDMVMRVLKEGAAIPLDRIDLSQRNRETLKRIIHHPYGLFFVCGPTGSGKTTTLHSVLGELNQSDVKIWTAEDPVEITQPGLRQVQVNARIGLTFANAMRAFLRADPDIIMVGEIRDQETAKTGIEASLTGHLVMSTLHTNSAPESISRLLDLGMDPLNFSDAILGILAQRLAKRLCGACRRAEPASAEEIEELLAEYCQEEIAAAGSKRKPAQVTKTKLAEWKQQFGGEDGVLRLSRPVGCEACEKTGYSGRVPLHEILEATDPLRAAIRERAPTAEISRLAMAGGMRTLRQDGIEKVLQGLTDMVQVRKVCTR